MKLTESNARFAVVRTAFHNGGTVAFADSLARAERIAAMNRCNECKCGCNDVVPVTKEARSEMIRLGYDWRDDEHDIVLYKDLPVFEPGKYPPYTICR